MLNSVRYDMHIIQYCICLQYIISICLRTWPAREAIIRRCPNNTVRVNTLERARARAWARVQGLGRAGTGAGADGAWSGRGNTHTHAHAYNTRTHTHAHAAHIHT